MSQKKKARGRPPKPPGEKKESSKNIRFHARTKALIEWWRAWERKTETGLIEAALEDYTDRLAKKRGVAFDQIYHSHPGVRWVRTYLVKGYPLTTEHERRRDFVMMHRDFFFLEVDGELIANITNIETLWPKISDYELLAGSRKWSDAGRAMGAALRARGIEPPHWPPRAQ